MNNASTPPIQLSNNNAYALSSERKALKANPKVGSSKRKPSKKAFIPKQYPKPTLAELAILVGTIKQNPQEQPLIEKTPPYQLKWMEQGVEISIYSENQSFISAQMLRLQTQKVQPMKPLAPKNQGVLPYSQENRPSLLPKRPPEETLTTTQREYVEFSPTTQIASVSREQQPQPIAPSINPSEAWLNSASTSELSALLGMLEGEYSSSPIEEPYPADIDLEFQTPVEAKIAAYLGVPYSSKTTISVAEQQPSVTDDSDALLLQEDEPALVVVATTDDYLSEEIEIDLDKQKAWLAAALEREKQKAYPLPKVEIAPLVAVELEATTPLATEVIETVDTLLITTPPEEHEKELTAAEEETLPPAVATGDNNEQAFAAVLDSLLEDFSSSDDDDGNEPSALEAEVLSEAIEDSVPVALQNTPEDHEPFEVVGFYAEQATASGRRDANDDDELSPSSGGITSENESDNPFDEITSFHQLLKVTTPETPMDFLLLGTFFLKQTEQTNAFSLRQLNQLLSLASKPNANHTVLELALSNHFITMVPDLTGLATATQYQLSKRGEASALRLFQAVTQQTQTS